VRCCVVVVGRECSAFNPAAKLHLARVSPTFFGALGLGLLTVIIRPVIVGEAGVALDLREEEEICISDTYRIHSCTHQRIHESSRA
jgi:hypothetical protein